MIGTNTDIFVYKLGKGEWEKKEFDKTSEF